MVLRAEGRAQEAHQSLDKAAERIEKRLRRYKGKLKDHRATRRVAAEPAASYVIAAPDEDSEAVVEDSPAIIAEETTNLETLTVGGAVMAMDLSDASVLVFRHAGHGGINVVYRRRDGHIGWIDPSLANKDKAGR